MGLTHSPKVVTDGLVFAYDASTTSKSLKGKPTTNYCYLQNPRIDSSYTPYAATTSGTWQAKHFDAITVYNQAGTDISAYVNTGVGDWTNTYHAIWTYDTVLKKPVVTMRDLDGQWKAKSFGIVSMSSMGLTHGSTYSISWLQWTSDTSKCAWAGIYQRRSSDGVYNFHDGLSGDQGTSYNTIPYKWQRVYATFTVTAGMDLSVGLGLYMYGMYGPYGTLKISDVQLEAGVASGFHNGETRSSTQAIVDPVSKNTITVSNLTYASNGNISFNGSNNYMDATGPSFVSGYSQYSICYWARRTTSNRMPVAAASGTSFYWYGDNSWFYTHGGATGEYYYPKSVTIADNTWGFFCCTYDGVNVKIYRNGVFEGQQASTGSANWSVGMRIGYWNGGAGYQWSGDIDSVTMYNVALSAAQVQQNFNARRGLYGL